MTDSYWGSQNVVVELAAPSAGGTSGTLSFRRQLLPKPPPELAELLEEDH
jgi:hypothetical protein